MKFCDYLITKLWPRRKFLLWILIIAVAGVFFGLSIKNYWRGSGQSKQEKKVSVFHKNQEGLNPKTLVELNLSENFKSAADFLSAKDTQKFLKPGDNLEEAVQNAESGAILVLPKGIFKVNLKIAKKVLVIIGQGAETVLEAKDNQQPVILVVEADATLRNFAVQNSRIGVDAEKSKISVQYLKFDNLAATAFYVNESYAELVDSFIYHSLSAFKALTSTGQIKHSIIASNGKAGVDLRNSYFEIEENKIDNNQSYGVILDQNSSAKINGNSIENNRGFNVRTGKTGDIYN